RRNLLQRVKRIARGRYVDRGVQPERPQRRVAVGLRRSMAIGARRRILRADESAAYRQPDERRRNRCAVRTGAYRRHHAAGPEDRSVQPSSGADRVAAQSSTRQTTLDATGPRLGAYRLADTRVSSSTENRLLVFAAYEAILAVVMWGALSFGAVYPWAYRTLAGASAVVGLAGLLLGRKNRPPVALFTVTLMLLGAAIAVQLLPFSRETLEKISPATINFLMRYDFSYVAGGSSHPISIAPAKTQLGLLLFGAFAILLIGVTKTVSRFGAQRLAIGVIAFGALLAVFGIVQEFVNLSNHYV